MELESKRLNGILAIAYSPDGKTLAVGGESPWIKLIDLTNGKDKATLKSHKSAVLALAFSPDGKTLASGSWDENQAVGRVRRKTLITAARAAAHSHAPDAPGD